MIKVTKKAVEKLNEVIEEFKKEDANIKEIYIRVGIKGGGCSGYQHILAVEDGKNDRDTVYNIDGLDFIIDNISVLYLEGTTLDFVSDLNKHGFKFTNPSAKTTCGCGSSFSM